MAPMTDMVSVGKRSPSTLMTDSAMTTAAPVRSITNPMMVPNTMDQANAAQDAAEAGTDRVGDLGQRHAIEEGREERGQDQHQERVPLQLRRAEDDERDDDGEPDDRHDPLFFGNCRVMTTIKRSNDESKPGKGLRCPGGQRKAVTIAGTAPNGSKDFSQASLSAWRARRRLGERAAARSGLQ